MMTDKDQGKEMIDLVQETLLNNKIDFLQDRVNTMKGNPLDKEKIIGILDQEELSKVKDNQELKHQLSREALMEMITFTATSLIDPLIEKKALAEVLNRESNSRNFKLQELAALFTETDLLFLLQPTSNLAISHLLEEEAQTTEALLIRDRAPLDLETKTSFSLLSENFCFWRESLSAQRLISSSLALTSTYMMLSSSLTERQRDGSSLSILETP